MRRRLGQGLALVLALAAGYAVTERLDTDWTNEPFLESVSVDEVAHLPYGDVEVTEVRPARHVAPGVSTELARIAAGVYVLVVVKVTASREPTPFRAAYLVDEEGRQYRTSAKADCAQTVPSSTGVPAYAVFCFDVPPEVLSGLRLHLARGSLVYETLQGDAVADFDLGIDAADEEAWPATEDAVLAQMTSREPIELQTVELEAAP